MIGVMECKLGSELLGVELKVHPLKGENKAWGSVMLIDNERWHCCILFLASEEKCVVLMESKMEIQKRAPEKKWFEFLGGTGSLKNYGARIWLLRTRIVVDSFDLSD